MADAIPERDLALLLDMVLAARDALEFVDGMEEAAFMASRLHQNAVIRSLEVIGEAAGKVSSATRTALDHIPWRDIIGMRHRLIHAYNDIEFDSVWNVVTRHLAPLIATLEPLIPAEEGPQA